MRVEVRHSDAEAGVAVYVQSEGEVLVVHPLVVRHAVVVNHLLEHVLPVEVETVEVTVAGEGVVFPAVFVQGEVRLNPGQVVFSFFKELGEVSDEAFLFVDSFFKLSPLLLQQRYLCFACHFGHFPGEFI